MTSEKGKEHDAELATRYICYHARSCASSPCAICGTDRPHIEIRERLSSFVQNQFRHSVLLTYVTYQILRSKFLIFIKFNSRAKPALFPSRRPRFSEAGRAMNKYYNASLECASSESPMYSQRLADRTGAPVGRLSRR